MRDKDKYSEWIIKHYPSKERALNRCNEAVRGLTAFFWELTVQVGYANGVYHCWAKDTEGRIIDPTAKQFDEPIRYTLIAERFLQKDEIEPATGAIFLTCDSGAA
jgi:membrane-anchored protein YejM (alkaline phosphatase superfamily)